jgi:16S rRNA (guanine1207-N2)-methyltransferase
MVTKRKEWYKQKFIGIYGGVKIHETDGYFVFCGEKRSYCYNNKFKENVR